MATTDVITGSTFHEDLDWSKSQLSMIFYFPTRHRRDLTNCLAWMKSGVDGIADALEVDDQHFSFGMSSVKYDKEHPRVQITITAGT